MHQNIQIITMSGNVRIFSLPKGIPVETHELLTGLSPDHQKVLGTLSHEARRNEFLRARYLVRHACAVTMDPPRDSDGIILWPSHIVGSVSHSIGDVVVATAPASEFRSIGIDLERPSRIQPSIAPKICTPQDLELVTACHVTLAEVFAAKEAFFKCHFPIGRKRFWFHDAEVASVSTSPRTITLRALSDIGIHASLDQSWPISFIAAPLNDAVLAVATL